VLLPRYFPSSNAPPVYKTGALLEKSVMSDARRFSVIPIRAVGLVRRQVDWRVLAALCTYTSPLGIAYPNQRTLARDAGLAQPHVSKSLRRLYELGLVRFLKPKGRKHPKAFRRGLRYQVLYEPNAPLPSAKEVEMAPLPRTGWRHE